MTSSSEPHSRPRPESRPRAGRDPAETRARLLEAAGRLFAERGYAGTSMRAVTRAAGVSVSAANYHFGSKQALLLETLGQVVHPINRERMQRLEALERAAGDAGLALEDVLEAFLAPAVEGRDASSGVDRFRQLAARLYSDPPDLVAAFKRENFGPITERFVDAISAALPGRDRAKLAIALQLVVGMMVHVISGQLRLGNPLGDLHQEALAYEATAALEGDALLRDMVRFAAAGLRQVAPEEGAR
jgi:AcrR family transcriptional regulator